MNTKTEKEVLEVLEQRFKKGRKSYGRGITSEEFGPDHWINEAIEEAADLLQYLVALRISLRKKNE